MAKLRAPVPKTTNSALLDAAVRHATRLEQFKNGEANKIIGMFNRLVVPDVQRELDSRLASLVERGSPTLSTARMRKLEDLNASLKQISTDAASRISKETARDLEKLSKLESDWQVGALKNAVPVEWDFQLPSPETLRQLVQSRPFEGHVNSEWWEGLGNATSRRMKEQLQIGLVRGEGTDDLVRRIVGTRAKKYRDGVLNVSRRDAEAIVRTSVNHVSTQTREETFKANADIVERVMIVATLDNRTTLICMGQDGKTYPVNEGPRPPFHYGCRTSVAPITKGWEELGLKAPSAGTRASMDGQVPATQTYGQWLENQDAKTQDEVLGPGRGELFRSGEIKIDEFVNDRGQTLTLEDLEGQIS